MVEYTRRVRTVRRVEYAIPSGSAWAELHKVLTAIRNELGEEAARWDDAARIEVRDDEVVLFFEREMPL
ncbi:hypothetical protein [Actinomadura violacea]|uniref:Uncharacterized protein n=1 Tax=Actinomadura violacea TaxID=2819934 RepID=A0ABS3RT96_9ACTN|nr:hypothetical protein [Actinomadura violacea]MBO2459861.1 hypothetical protein [Actinomadura violacea]